MPELIGQYRIEKKLGEGGMGAVYLGTHARLKSRAAIKTILHSSLESEEAIHRLDDEGQALASLAHENIVRVLDLFTEGNRHYLVMEYVEGESLDQLLKRTTPDLQTGLEIAIKVGEGIAAAHRMNIMHRDIKPANVMVGANGKVKVMDFGLAKFADATTKTRTGHVVGTPRYMSPEQVTGQQLDHRSDQYSYGVLLYRMVAGREPFTDANSMALVYKHVHEVPPPPTEFNPALPLHLVDIILCTLAKHPEERFASMDDLLSELRLVQEEIAPLPSILVTTHDHHAGGRTPSAMRSAGRTPSAIREAASPKTPSAIRAQYGTGNSPALPSRTAPRAPLTGTRPVAQQAQSAAGDSGAGFTSGEVSGTRSSGHSLALAFILIAGMAGIGAAGAFIAWKKGWIGGKSGPGAANPAAKGGGSGWVRVEPPAQPVRLGVGDDNAPPEVSGFRPSRGITSPTAPYEIQAHEVSWGEIDPWLASHTEISFVPPVWVPQDPSARKALPVGGIPWQVARAYCSSLGGTLPTEEQWEFAARGAERRRYPWGDEPPAEGALAAYRPEGTLPSAVGAGELDKTPGDAPIFDLAGNVQEWMLDFYREDLPGQDESAARSTTRPLHSVRGLPFMAPAPAAWPLEGAAVRDRLCGEGQCVDKFAAERQYIGFRCVRPVG